MIKFEDIPQHDFCQVRSISGFAWDPKTTFRIYAYDIEYIPRHTVRSFRIMLKI